MLLYVVITICLLIGYQPTANFENQRSLQISQLSASRQLTNLFICARGE